ncbi:hypothetical protein QVD99_000896 [Batrachochytrium dendrobatidis]|nr:hypothetical protein O5D80_003747 [Batrachochytrium dendrobatidis]KAK5673449.1 hypothetical protein QVD99_000896 [Batrachochytrium dendrobatidis]
MQLPFSLRISPASAVGAFVLLFSAISSVVANPMIHDLHKTNVRLSSITIGPKGVDHGKNISIAIDPKKGVSNHTIKSKSANSALTSASASHFVVSVQRVDMLVDDGSNSSDGTSHTPGLVGAKYSQILLNFDVSPDTKKISVNGVSVPMGITEIKVTAKTAVSIDKSADRKAALKAFDKGIVKVQITASGSDVHHDGIIIRRILISERVFEVNGKLVTQGSRIQQVIEIFPDGTVHHGKPHDEKDGSVPLTIPSSEVDSHEASEEEAPKHVDITGAVRTEDKKLPADDLDMGCGDSMGSDPQESNTAAKAVHAPHHFLVWLHKQPVYIQVLTCLSGSVLVVALACALLNAVTAVVSFISLRCTHSRLQTADAYNSEQRDSDEYDSKYKVSFEDPKAAEAKAESFQSITVEPLPEYCPDPTSDTDVLLGSNRTQ